jgi:parallel beta-helix repeat protein
VLKITTYSGTTLKVALFFLCWAAILFYEEPCVGKTYYVDSINGMDSNAGTSVTEAFRTLKNIHKLRFSPGDKLLFRKGSRFHGKLKLEATGEEGHPVVISSYGEGPKPIFENPTAISSWKQDSKGRHYFFTGKNHCYGMFEDGEKVKQALDGSLTHGRWFFNKLTRTLYFRPGETKPARYTYASSYYLFLLRSCENVVIKDLHFRYAGGGIVADKGKRIKIIGCDFEGFYESGIMLKDVGGFCTIADNSLRRCGDGIYLTRNCLGNNSILNNQISYCNYNEYNNNDGHAIGIQNCSDNLILRNVISFCIDPIAIWADKNQYTNNNTIAYNLITDCKKAFNRKYLGKAVSVGPTEKNHATGNKIYYNIIRRCNFGIKLKKSNSPSNLIFNNVIDDCNVAVVLSQGADHNQFFNNIFYKSFRHHILSEHKNNGDRNFFDYNCYFPDMRNGFVHKSKIIISFETWREKTGGDARSIISNPNFSDNNSFQLRSSSNCIDAGQIIPIKKDFYGNDIFHGNGVDIGIAEFSFSKTGNE